jgi:aryl-alcohol dehydrogenase-like predicted oxidoreductase
MLARRALRQLQTMTTTDDFLYREVLGKRVHRLAISGSYGLTAADLREAFDRGVNYLFWSPVKPFLKQLVREVVAKDRDRFLLATGPALGYFPGSLRRSVESALRESRSDYLDVLQMFWAGVMSSLRPRMVDELVKLRDEGKVRAIGVAIHDRKRAAALAASGPLDFFMIRYNAAHPGAETDIFPRLPEKRPLIAAYTATSWGRLLRSPRGWKGPAATAADCYRFCLANPNVDVVVSAPKTTDQLRENLAGIEQGPLSDEELDRMRALGRVVHGWT